MTYRRIAVACTLIFVAAGQLLAQAPNAAPKPSEAHKRLQYFVGTWNNRYDMKQSAFGPGGKGTGIDRNELLPGGFFIVTHSSGKGPMGEMKELAVMGYNAEEKAYTYNAFNSFGEAEVFKGAVDGSTWTWTSDMKVEGKMMKGRFTLTEVSPTSYTYSFDTSTDGSTWTNIMEGKATKAKRKTT